MSQPQRYRMTFTGITPLLMHSNAGLLGPQEDKGRDKLQWEKDHMADLLYRNASGDLVIPARAIKAMLISACRFVTDKPKGTMFKSFGPLIEGAVFIEEDATLDVSPDKVVPYVAVVNLDPSKGPRGPRGPRCRPMVPLPWRGETAITVLDAALKEDALGKIAEAGGKFCGLLDGRRVDFGRSDITVAKL